MRVKRRGTKDEEGREIGTKQDKGEEKKIRGKGGEKRKRDKSWVAPDAQVIYLRDMFNI